MVWGISWLLIVVLKCSLYSYTVVLNEYILVVYCMFAAFNLLHIDATRGVQVLCLKSENLEGGWPGPGGGWPGQFS